MLEFIIWMIIVVAIIMRSKKKAEQNRQNGQRPVQQTPQYRAPQPQQRPVQQTPQYRAPQPQQRPVQQPPQYRAPQQQTSQYRAPQPQQRPVQQTPPYRAPQQQTPPYRAPQPQQNMQKGNILERATENVRKYEEDVLEKSELMEELNDLMLMGYQTKLSYERDFVAEGIELLNSYELPVA